MNIDKVKELVAYFKSKGLLEEEVRLIFFTFYKDVFEYKDSSVLKEIHAIINEFYPQSGI